MLRFMAYLTTFLIRAEILSTLLTVIVHQLSSFLVSSINKTANDLISLFLSAVLTVFHYRNMFRKIASFTKYFWQKTQ